MSCMHHRRQRALRRAAARARLEGPSAAGSQRGHGRHHGHGRDRARRRRCAAPHRLPGRRMEPHASARCRASRASTAPEGLDAFLARTEILVCLLPHTPETEGILNLTLLRKLKRDGALGGAYLVNGGRGKAAGRRRHRRGARRGRAWPAPRSTYSPPSRCRRKARCGRTPRSPSRRTMPATLLRRRCWKRVFAQIDAFERGEPLRNQVDRRSGY